MKSVIQLPVKNDEERCSERRNQLKGITRQSVSMNGLEGPKKGTNMQLGTKENNAKEGSTRRVKDVTLRGYLGGRQSMIPGKPSKVKREVVQTSITSHFRG